MTQKIIVHPLCKNMLFGILIINHCLFLYTKMADFTPDIFSNNVSSHEVAQLVSAFIPSSFYLTSYINYLLAVPLPRNAQGCHIIDPDWKDQIRETIRHIFSNPVLVLKLSSANYAEETRYPPNYNFSIGINGIKGAFPDSTRYQEFPVNGDVTSGPLKLTPALIVAYCLSNGGTSNFRLQKLESDKLTKSYSSYIHDDELAKTWNPLLAAFLFLLKLINSIGTFKGTESAFLPMIEFTWHSIIGELDQRKPSLSVRDGNFYKWIKPTVDAIEREGTHRLFTYTHQFQKAIGDELKLIDTHFTQVLSSYCK